ncbi:MAG: CBS domain-containing protein [Nitrososphaerota archaeon]|jgi:IMP dehydrogenase|nr:CBS domain-containing protein [Nitrososphaerota archaeon]
MVLYAKDVVEPTFLCLPPDTNALEAARLMRDKRQGYVVVVTEGKPEGIVTEWDYLSKVVAEGKETSKVVLREIMSGGPISVSANEGIEGVARIMTEKGVRRVLVVQQGKVVGVITSRTILARLEEYIDKVSTTIARLQAPPP